MGNYFPQKRNQSSAETAGEEIVRREPMMGGGKSSTFFLLSRSCSFMLKTASSSVSYGPPKNIMHKIKVRKTFLAPPTPRKKNNGAPNTN